MAVTHKAGTSRWNEKAIGIRGDCGSGTSDIESQVKCKLCLRNLRRLTDPRNATMPNEIQREMQREDAL